MSGVPVTTRGVSRFAVIAFMAVLVVGMFAPAVPIGDSPTGGVASAQESKSPLPLEWEYNASQSFAHDVAVANGGNVYVAPSGSSDYRMYSLDPDGNLRWTDTLGGTGIKSLAANESSDSLYYGYNGDTDQLAVRGGVDDGTGFNAEWAGSNSGCAARRVEYEPSGKNVFAYDGCEDMAARNAGGGLKWTKTLPNFASGAMGSSQDTETLYISQGDVLAIDSGGTTLWSTSSNINMQDSTGDVVVDDSTGTVYVAGGDGGNGHHLEAYDADPSQSSPTRYWNYTSTNGNIVSAAVDEEDGFLFLGYSNGTIEALNVSSPSSGSPDVISRTTSEDYGDASAFDWPRRMAIDESAERLYVSDDESDTAAFDVSSPDVPTYEVSGTVVDQNDDPLQNANVTVRDGSVTVDTLQTDANGSYSIYLDNGTYDFEAWKGTDEYRNDTATVTVDGGPVTQNFTLLAESEQLHLDAPKLLEHGQSRYYDVHFVDENNNAIDVTDDANTTVTSLNTSIVTVNTTSNELEATTDTAVAARVNVVAEYTHTDGQNYTTTQEVTVASVTLEDAKVLPTTFRYAALLGDWAIIVFIVAGGVGIVGTRGATPFAGLAGMEMIILIGWFGGYVSTGVMYVSLFAAVFIGLNLAANIDYAIQR